MSSECDIFEPEHQEVCQDMSQPLSHYFIASSYNTYVYKYARSCIGSHTHVRAHTHMLTYANRHTHANLCTQTHICLLMHTQIHIYMCICIQKHMCTCARTHTNPHIHMRLRGLTGSVLDHRSLPPEFEPRCGNI